MNNADAVWLLRDDGTVHAWSRKVATNSRFRTITEGQRLELEETGYVTGVPIPNPTPQLVTKRQRLADLSGGKRNRAAEIEAMLRHDPVDDLDMASNGDGGNESEPEKPVFPELPDLVDMTKLEIARFAKDHLGITIDSALNKGDLIKAVTEKYNEEAKRQEKATEI